jgi:hypothetical protein
MTVKGFAAAGSLKKGQCLLHYVGKDEPALFGNNKQHAPAVAKEVFRALQNVSGVVSPSAKVTCSALDFHGDAERFQGDVEVVGSYCQLGRDRIAKTSQSFAERNFSWGNHAEVCLAGSGHAEEAIHGSGTARYGSMGGGDLGFSLLVAHAIPDSLSRFGQTRTHVLAGHGELGCLACASHGDTSLSQSALDKIWFESEGYRDVDSRLTSEVPINGGGYVDGRPLRFGSAANLDTSLYEGGPQGCPSDVALFRNLLQRFAGTVVLDQIVEIDRFHYDGPVYDFESPLGYIVAQSLLISNCGAACSMSVGQYFGIGPDTLDEWKKALGTSVKESTHPTAIERYFRSQGCEVEANSFRTIDDLADCCCRDTPTIVCIQDYGPRVPEGARFPYGHYIVIIGRLPGYLIGQDPSEDNCIAGGDNKDLATVGSIQQPGRIIISDADFLRAWKDRDAEGNKFIRWGCSIGKPEKQAAAEEDDEDDGAKPKLKITLATGKLPWDSNGPSPIPRGKSS